MNYDFLNGSENVKAEEGLKRKVGAIMLKNRFSIFAKTACVSAAAIVLCFTAGANLSSNFAYAMSDIPVLRNVVRVVTLGRYEKKIGGSEAVIVTPQLDGLADSELEKKINAELGAAAAELRSQFEKDAEEIRSEYGNDAHMGIQYDYTIRTDTEDYFAIDVYYLNIVGSSSTTHKFYTIDRRTGELITLSGLFKEDADYVERISGIVMEEMIRQNEQEDGMFFVEPDEFGDGFTGIAPEQNFYINSDGELVICFDKYEVAAGAQGCPEFVIERSKIKDILA